MPLSACQTAKESLAEFFARRQKIVLIVFSGGMYVGGNTSHGASVELFACGEQPRHRAQCSLFVKEPRFFDKLRASGKPDALVL